MSNDLLVWIVLWVVVGGSVTPIVYGNKGRTPVAGIIVGALVGGLGGIFLLMPLWILLPYAGKTCPQCAEEVRKAARICKHCGYEFPADADAATPSQVPLADDIRQLALHHPATTTVHTLMDAEHSQAIMAITAFQLAYLQHHIATPSTDQQGWFVMRHHLDYMARDAQALAELRTQAESSAVEGPLLRAKANELKTLHEKLQTAMGDYDGFEIAWRPLNEA